MKYMNSVSISTSNIHPFNGPLSRNTWNSWYQKGKTNLDFTEASDSEWQWHQVGKSAPHSRQTTTPAPHHSVFTGQMPFLLPNQQCQSTEGIQFQQVTLANITITTQKTRSENSGTGSGGTFKFAVAEPPKSADDNAPRRCCLTHDADEKVPELLQRRPPHRYHPPLTAERDVDVDAGRFEKLAARIDTRRKQPALVGAQAVGAEQDTGVVHGVQQ